MFRQACVAETESMHHLPAPVRETQGPTSKDIGLQCGSKAVLHSMETADNQDYARTTEDIGVQYDRDMHSIGRARRAD